MSRRLAAFAAAVGLVAFACRPIPAPSDGVLSLSEVKLPSPGVVAGDTMRDSTGQAAPVRVVAYGTGGQSDTITNITPTFISFDPGAHVTSDGYVIGDSVRDTPVRIIGSVGPLQTSPANIYVTPLPDSLADTTASPTDTVRFTPDSTAAADYSVELVGQVLATGVIPTAPVQAVIVRYTLLYAPPGANGGVTGVLVDPSGRPSSVDTSDASGFVSRRIRVRPAAAPLPADSFVVRMSAEYAGVSLHGSPWRIVVPIRGH